MDKYECKICHEMFDASETYEHRGFTFCRPHFAEGTGRVEEKRQEVMEVTEASIKSQRNGEFINNRGKYHLENVAADGLPRIVPKEPQILKDYENGVL